VDTVRRPQKSSRRKPQQGGFISSVSWNEEMICNHFEEQALRLDGTRLKT
jgi:hypothetical protein